MQVAAKLKGVRISAQKARLVIDEIRGKNVNNALDILKFTNKKSAGIILKLLNSAIANADNNNSADVDELYVAHTFVDEGPTLKRHRARAKGRGNRILKPTSHITVVVSDEKKSEKR